jgi:acylphosphatase
MPDGAVEAVLQGNTDAVKLLCNHCEHGPPHAEVIAVNTSQWEYDNTVFTFEVRR